MKHTIIFVKRGRGSTIVWECMAVSGTGSLTFIDDVTAQSQSNSANWSALHK